MITKLFAKTAREPLCHIGKSGIRKKPTYCTYSTYSIGAFAACLTQPPRPNIMNPEHKNYTPVGLKERNRTNGEL